MIAWLEGTVDVVGTDFVVLAVGGIGYRVAVPPALLAETRPGERLRLHTYHLVREDQQALYGFRSADELGFFTLLLTVTGVGPKVALAIVGSRPVADLQLAVLQEDVALLTAIPGVGRKLAERLIFELREKVAAAGTAAGAPGGEPEVVAALVALGYSPGEARQAARAAAAAAPSPSPLEERVKAALRALAGG